MLGAVGLDGGARRDIVLQAGFYKQSDCGREIVLQAEACGNRPLPGGTEGGLLRGFQDAVQVIACVERRVDRNLRRQAEAAVEAPSLAIIHIIYTSHGDAEIVDALLLVDCVAIGTHLELRTQEAVAQPCLQSEATIQLILQRQRDVDGHIVVALADDLVRA